MKTTINANELKELSACTSGYKTFVEAHEDKTVKLSEALESNGIDDLFWLLDEIPLSTEQENDLRLLACDYASDVLHIFEEKYPTDKRPRLAIEAARKYINGEISKEELDDVVVAAAAARAAARSATVAARAAARSATVAAVADYAASAVADYAASATTSSRAAARSATVAAVADYADYAAAAARAASRSATVAAAAARADYAAAATVAAVADYAASAVADYAASATTSSRKTQSEQLMKVLLKWENK